MNPDQPAPPSRRGAILIGGAVAGSALWLAGCGKGAAGGQVGAVEDLMREHGVLRRILVVYRQAAILLRVNPTAVDAGALAEAARLFRAFGEDYHERQLEEAYIFPRLEKAGGPAAALVGLLRGQHARGREITGFLQSVFDAGRVTVFNAEPAARALESMAQMYEAHSAFEDTVLFPAWRKTLSKAQLDEMAGRFEGIERRAFKGDGFDMAEAGVTRIERRLNLHDLSFYTAPAPPQVENAAPAALAAPGAD
jgi:hemerythrin-like domain-containing protein